MTALIFFDFEVFQNLWTVVFIDPMKREETVIINDKEKLETFYQEHKNEIFVGYNCRNYDQWIFKSILCGFNPKEVNDWIILKDRKGWEFSDLLRKFPINTFDVFNGANGLKTLEAFMGNDIRETTIPFDYTGEFTPDMINEVIKYNRHDVLQTLQVFKHRINEFNSHVALLDTFNLPASHISKTQAQLASIILGAKRVETNDEWNIRVPHTLQLTKYQYIADWFLNPENHDEEKYLETEVAGVPHIFAWGGVHGALSQYNRTCKEDEVMIMADVDQLYPSMMVYYNLLSRAVHEPSRFKIILDTSLKLKREKKKVEREPYKRICNITYGAMGDKFNAMYDPLHRRLVCIFGQLLLLDLLEKIESFTQVIQSNTDGILVKLKRDDVPRFKDVVKAWEERVMLRMSYDEFERVIQKDVNNYVAIDYKGEYKCKGAYVKSLNALDNDLPIVNRAIINYLVKGVHPRDTVMGCDRLIDFQKVVKVSSKYEYGTLNGERLTDKTFRVFASRRLNDGAICKVKKILREWKPFDKCDYFEPYIEYRTEKFANTPEKCFIWNESVTDVPTPLYLDKSWYVELAIKRLADYGVTL